MKVGTLSLREMPGSTHGPTTWAYELLLPKQKIRDHVVCENSSFISVMSAIMANCANKSAEDSSYLIRKMI